MKEENKRGGGSRPHSIRYKITGMALAVSAAAVVLCAITALSGILLVRKQALAANRSLGNMAASDSDTALTLQAQLNLRSNAQDRAAIVQERLLSIVEKVDAAAGYMTAVYSCPDEFLPFPVAPPALENEGKWALQYSLPDGVAYETVREEIDLAGNFIHTASSLSRSTTTISSIYFVSESGFMISYDKNSDNMFEGKKEGDPPELFPSHYDPRGREWYQDSIKKKKAVFNKAYLDAFGRLMITCATPVFGQDRETVGVLAMDLLIEDMNQEVVSAPVGENGYVILMDREGYVVTMPDLAVVDGQFESVKLSDQPEFSKLALAMMDKKSGISVVELEGRKQLAAYAPVPVTGWSLILLLPEEEAVAPAVESRDHITAQTERTAAEMSRIIGVVMAVCALASLFILAAVCAAAWFFGRKLTGPIVHMTQDVEQIGRGNLEHHVSVSTGDELETLAAAFNQMTVSLRQYMENLSKVLADRERIATELHVAAAIQASMLPCRFPAFPERGEFDLFAYMTPAKEVGGDFYDFFMTDQDHLWLVIADVSGKGVPASLFMVIAKTMIHNYASLKSSPAEVLTSVNEQLCKNNDAGMFVTAFLGVLTISNGEFIFSNAGHNYPLFAVGLPDENGMCFNWLETEPDFVLAGLEDIQYREHRRILTAGSCLFLYTDGVTEALNPSMELYGEERLCLALNRLEARSMDPEELISYIKSEVVTFCRGADQADDITMAALKIRMPVVQNAGSDTELEVRGDEAGVQTIDNTRSGIL